MIVRSLHVLAPLCLMCLALTACGERDRGEPVVPEEMGGVVERDAARDMRPQDEMGPGGDMKADLAEPDESPDVDMNLDPDMTQGDPCEGVVCGNGNVCQPNLEGACTLPQSCADMKTLLSSAQDAPLSDQFYTLYYQGTFGSPWQAWCSDMGTDLPLTYLPLAMTHGDHNVFERFGEPFQPSITPPTAPRTPYQRRLTRTRYEKVRLDPYTLEIDVTDTRFAQTEVIQDQEDDLGSFVRPVPFGVAEGCALQIEDASLRQNARGRLDLRNTPFELSDPDWAVSGVCPIKQDVPDPEEAAREISLEITGGGAQGGCGVVAPERLLKFFPTGCGQSVTLAEEALLEGEPQHAIKLDYVSSTPPLRLRPKTCAEAKLLERCDRDGSCTLYVGRSVDRSWRADCHDMDQDEPLTYWVFNDKEKEDISGRDTNITEISTNERTAGQTVRLLEHSSFYSALRVDGHTMRVDITDQKFAEGRNAPPAEFGVSRSCFDYAGTGADQQFTRARVKIDLRDATELRFGKAFLPYGECFSRATIFADSTDLSPPAPQSDPVSRQGLIYGGDYTATGALSRSGCGGYAPYGYAMQQGYLACDAEAGSDLYRRARPSSEDRWLFDLVHVDGNP